MRANQPCQLPIHRAGSLLRSSRIDWHRHKTAPIQDILKSPDFLAADKKLPLALGIDDNGHPVIGDLAVMPHLLVAGAIGNGKSMCMNSIISSMLMKFRPDELKLILIDPKMMNMPLYSRLPHLMAPVVTDPGKVPRVLRWCVNEMKRRYYCFAKTGVRNFDAFNKRPPDVPARKEEEQENRAIPERFPYLVIIIDELANLMQPASQDMETDIGILTRGARAAGIHLIAATQTPKKQVVTRTIKANIPTRIAFQVASGTDSRVILDRQGAEKLVGKGDLLYLPPGSAQVKRVQGAFISDVAVKALVAHCASQARQEFDEGLQKSLDNPSPETSDTPA